MGKADPMNYVSPVSTNRNRFAMLASLGLVFLAASCPAQAVWDLKKNPSDAINPNRIWTDPSLMTALPLVTGWPFDDGWISTTQDGWACWDLRSQGEGEFKRR
jgi:hypothetical protein